MEETKVGTKRFKPSSPRFLLGFLALAAIVLVTRPLWGNALLDEPFLRAVLAKDSRSAEVWLKRGADINAMWKTAYSAVDIAIHNEDKETASVLLKFGSSLPPSEASRLQGLVDISHHVCAFDRRAWLDQNFESVAQPRGGMVADLIDFHLPNGMSKKDVVALLGPPDIKFDPQKHGHLGIDELTSERIQDIQTELQYRTGTDTTHDGSSYAFDLEIGFDSNNRVCAKLWDIE